MPHLLYAVNELKIRVRRRIKLIFSELSWLIQQVMVDASGVESGTTREEVHAFFPLNYIKIEFFGILFLHFAEFQTVCFFSKLSKTYMFHLKKRSIEARNLIRDNRMYCVSPERLFMLHMHIWTE